MARTLSFVHALVLAAAAALSGAPAQAQTTQAFQTMAPQAILIDADTRHRAVREERRRAERAGEHGQDHDRRDRVSGDQGGRPHQSTREFIISENAWRRGGAGSGGSSMFANVNSSVKLADLLRGIIVQSGNDAAIAARRRGGRHGRKFCADDDRAGPRARLVAHRRSATPRATARRTRRSRCAISSKLALHIIETYPELVQDLSRSSEFTWNKIRQQNRNPLLTMDIGADGLKTGNIDESGYGLIGSAVQNGQRLIVAVERPQDRQGPRPRDPQAPRLGFSRLRVAAALRRERVGRRGERLRRRQRARVPLVLATSRSASSCRAARTSACRRQDRLQRARCARRWRRARRSASCRSPAATARPSKSPSTPARMCPRAASARRPSTAFSRPAAGSIRRAFAAVDQPRSDAGTVHHLRGRGGGRQVDADRAPRGRLAALGHRVRVTREPGGSPRAEAIRGVHPRRRGKAARARRRGTALLRRPRSTTSRRTIRPALERGVHVLCDRFADSTARLPGALGQVDAALLRALDRGIVGETRARSHVHPRPAGEGGPLPRAGAARARPGPTASRPRSPPFHQALREAFLAIAAAAPERCAVVDATPAPDEVEEAIFALLARRLPDLARPAAVAADVA